MRVLKIVMAVLSVALGAMLFSSNVASAGTGGQWCDTGGWCLNAWNGGPYVKAYSYSAVNNDFSVVNTGQYTTSTNPGHGIPAGQPFVNMKFTGSGPWVGHCIGDASNDPGIASSSLDVCGTGWGTNMVYLSGSASSCGNAYALLYDVHWNGYVRWNGNSNGATVFLNNASGYCFHELPPA